MDISAITELIMAYAAGDFSRKGEVSERRDETDTIISGINMLGEELESTLISRDYFSSLYNALTDMVFVLNNLGEIEDFNQSVTNLLHESSLSLKGTPIDRFFRIEDGILSSMIRRSLSNGSKSMVSEGFFKMPDTTDIPVSITASEVYRKSQYRWGYLLIVKDIRAIKEQESMIFRTIVETQEAERRRVADDLHDSLGQKLSAVKYYLNAMGNQVESAEAKKVVRNAKVILDDSIQDLRDIVFGQMPITLERFGLAKAVEELTIRIGGDGIIDFHVEVDDSLPQLPSNLQVVIYRVVQEFVQNTFKHAQAKNIYIDIMMKRKRLMLMLEDDGKGFDPKIVNNQPTGRGLRNMITRVKAFNGDYQILTEPGQGVKLTVSFNINQ